MRASRGFTLLEVMVVLVIIALMIGMATLNVGGNELKREAEQEAIRFVARFDAYRNEAVFQNTDLGLAMDGQETQLLKFTDIRDPADIQGKNAEEIAILEKNPWEEYSSNGLKPSQGLPENYFYRIELDGTELELAELIEDEDGVKPALLFLSSDEYTPFKLFIEHDEDDSFAIELSGDGIGAITMVTHNYED